METGSALVKNLMITHPIPGAWRLEWSARHRSRYIAAHWFESLQHARCHTHIMYASCAAEVHERAIASSAAEMPGALHC